MNMYKVPDNVFKAVYEFMSTASYKQVKIAMELLEKCEHVEEVQTREEEVKAVQKIEAKPSLGQ